MDYHHAALGGTFDHLHRGHHHLLQTAANVADRITIGLTTKPLYKQKELSDFIQSYQERLQSLQKYLEKNQLKNRTNIIPLKDPYGPTLKKSTIDCLVVSEQTLTGAKRTNKKRQKLHLTPLPIEVAQLITDDAGHYLSSTRIRKGLVSRDGFTYYQVLKNTYTLTNDQKQTLRSPQGPIVSDIKPSQLKNSPRIALVGDQTTKYFIQSKLPFNYAVIDHHINQKRRPFPEELLPDYPVINSQNPSGQITQSAANAISQLVKNKTGLIIIKGEEDLIGVPLALLLPLKSHIFYGQRNQGIVKITVTETYKQKMVALLKNS